MTRDPRDLDYPWYLPWGSVVGAVFVAVEALRHRVDEWGGDVLWPAVPLMVVAVSPFFLDLLGHHRDRFLLGRLPFGALTLAPVIALLVQSPTDTDFAPFLIVLVCIQGVATSAMWESLLIVGAACGSLIGVEAAGEFNGTGIWVVGNLAAFGGGLAVRQSVKALTHERAMHASHIERAALDERQRIAREVHDVIAHSLSVTMLHLTGARRALETDRDVDEAVEALRDAERLGRLAMADIRRTVGLLAPSAGGETEPTPGVADIHALVEGFRSAGLDVSCEVAGDPGSVSLATGLGLYRIAQESLANVAKHAPSAPARVSLELGDSVRMRVVSGSPNGTAPLAPPSAGGLGLKGMEERARLLGGTFRAVPDGDGWLVEVTVPQTAEAG